MSRRVRTMSRTLSAAAAAHIVTVKPTPLPPSNGRPAHHVNDTATAFDNPWASYKDYDVKLNILIPWEIRQRWSVASIVASLTTQGQEAAAAQGRAAKGRQARLGRRIA